MLADAPPEQVAEWERVPEDGRWYILVEPVLVQSDPLKGAQGWPNLASGPRYWKAAMFPSAESYAKLLRVYGVEPYCTVCPKYGHGLVSSAYGY